MITSRRAFVSAAAVVLLFTAAYRFRDCIVVRLSQAGWQSPVALALRTGMSPSSVCKDVTMLHAAVASHNADLVRLLLTKGADVNGHSRMGSTPLIAATSSGQDEMIRVLLAAGANVNQRPSPEESLLLAPVHNGYSETVRLLISHGLDVRRDSAQLLIEAARLNNPEMTSILLDAGAMPNARGDRGATPLMWAARLSSPQIVRLILEHGADPAIKDDDQLTSIDWAHKAQREDIVSILVTFRGPPH